MAPRSQQRALSIPDWPSQGLTLDGTRVRGRHQWAGRGQVPHTDPAAKEGWCPMGQCGQAPTTYTAGQGFNNRPMFSSVVEAGSPGSACQQALLLARALPGRADGHLVSVLRRQKGQLPSVSSHKDTRRSGPGPTLMTSFNLNYAVRRTSLVVQTVKNLPTIQETWVLSLGWEDPLQNGLATRSSILAWRVPWTEEPGGLPFMGSQRPGHD